MAMGALFTVSLQMERVRDMRRLGPEMSVEHSKQREPDGN